MDKIIGLLGNPVRLKGSSKDESTKKCHIQLICDGLLKREVKIVIDGESELIIKSLQSLLNRNEYPKIECRLSQINRDLTRDQNFNVGNMMIGNGSFRSGLNSFSDILDIANGIIIFPGQLKTCCKFFESICYSKIHVNKLKIALVGWTNAQLGSFSEFLRFNDDTVTVSSGVNILKDIYPYSLGKGKYEIETIFKFFECE